MSRGALGNEVGKNCAKPSSPDENDTALRRLTAKMEDDVGGGWTVDRMGERYERMRTRIIAFRAEIRDRHATFKLGQDERPDHFASIADRLGDRRLADWMHHFRGSDD